MFINRNNFNKMSTSETTEFRYISSSSFDASKLIVNFDEKLTDKLNIFYNYLDGHIGYLNLLIQNVTIERSFSDKNYYWIKPDEYSLTSLHDISNILNNSFTEILKNDKMKNIDIIRYPCCCLHKENDGFHYTKDHSHDHTKLIKINNKTIFILNGYQYTFDKLNSFNLMLFNDDGKVTLNYPVTCNIILSLRGFIKDNIIGCSLISYYIEILRSVSEHILNTIISPEIFDESLIHCQTKQLNLNTRTSTNTSVDVITYGNNDNEFLFLLKNVYVSSFAKNILNKDHKMFKQWKLSVNTDKSFLKSCVTMLNKIFQKMESAYGSYYKLHEITDRIKIVAGYDIGTTYQVKFDLICNIRYKKNMEGTVYTWINLVKSIRHSQRIKQTVVHTESIVPNKIVVSI